MKRRTHGFTLLELMVVLTIAGLLLGIGVPALGNFIRNARLTAAANDFLAELHFARSEAIKRRLPVSVCTSLNPLDETPTCEDSDTLAGWIVFVDHNGDGDLDAAPEQVLRRHAALPDTITARSSSSPLAITYRDTGFAQDTAGSQLVMCDARGNVSSAGALSAARGIRIAPTGRPEVTRETGQIDGLLAGISGAVGGCGG